MWRFWNQCREKKGRNGDSRSLTLGLTITRHRVEATTRMIRLDVIWDATTFRRYFPSEHRKAHETIEQIALKHTTRNLLGKPWVCLQTPCACAAAPPMFVYKLVRAFVYMTNLQKIDFPKVRISQIFTNIWDKCAKIRHSLRMPSKDCCIEMTIRCRCVQYRAAFRG